jgi:hypothetical protein
LPERWFTFLAEMFTRIRAECHKRDFFPKKYGDDVTRKSVSCKSINFPGKKKSKAELLNHFFYLLLFFLSSEYNQTSGELYNTLTSHNTTVPLGVQHLLHPAHTNAEEKNTELLLCGEWIYMLCIVIGHETQLPGCNAGLCKRLDDVPTQLTIQLLACTKPTLRVGIIT